ncbi:hypothetical protein [Ideonella sp. A 288]|uniref:hypothetical protein n=1 Tax=Ideonella sp. A 288 TaxID=1962181 RepID=UPI000B4AC325|nr:hypothetical protein [Ideonella sp. A 288]
MKQYPHASLAGALVLMSGAATADIALKLGPVDPVSHFPAYVADVGRVAVQPCLDGDGTTGPCRFEPAGALPGNLWAATVGFGAEAAYSLAQATLVMPSGRRAELTLGLMAGYRPNVVADGNQQVFSRLAYRIQVPGPGVYKVFHPYMAFPACLPDVHLVPVGGLPVINHRAEVGGGSPFRALVAGATGNVLRWDPAVPPLAPAGYVGDPQVTHTITGSACNVHAFRIEGPNIAGPGLSVASTAQFSVSGKLYTAAATAPVLAVDRATYDRTGNITRLNVFARADASATVTMQPVTGLTPAATLTPDGAGNFFVQLSAATSPPQSLTLTTNPALPSASLTVPVTDQVNVVSAIYNPTLRALEVRATSSDKGVPPTLTAQVGDAPPLAMVRQATTGEYLATLSKVAAPPPSVTVVSSKGGRDVRGLRD